MEEIVRWVTGFSESFGITRDPVVDMIILLVALSIIGMLFAVLSVARRETKRPAGVYDGRGVAARLEKLEMAFNALKTEVARANQLNRGELGYLAQEVRQIKAQLGGEPAEEEQRVNEDDGFTRPASLMDPAAAEGQEEPEELEAGSESEAAAEEMAAQAPPEGVDDSDRHAAADKAEKKTEKSGEPASLVDRLQKTRVSLFGRIVGLFTGGAKIDESTLGDLEEILISADLGVKTASSLVEDLKKNAGSSADLSQDALLKLLRERILDLLEKDSPIAPGIVPLRQEDGPFVLLLVGVNGTGKTTTAAKLASQWKSEGRKVLLVAADTYRAAAVEQLCQWGERIGVPVYRGENEAKPATVVFDAMEKAGREAVDVVIIDTAGRLHTKSNLMQELQGVQNIIRRHQASAPHDTVLVVDGTTGQNAVAQARQFHEALGLTGVIITKLDGTPKGGVVIAIKSEFNIPVRYIGIGETSEDLRPFIPSDFVSALL